jgi:hypothetical protein
MLELVIVLLLPAALGYLALAVVRAVRAWADRDRSTGAVPVGPPIERTASDLRRLNRQRHELRRERSVPGRALRFRAIDAAYHDVLLVACRALEVAPPAVMPSGAAVSADVARVERELERQGLDVGRHRGHRPGADARGEH